MTLITSISGIRGTIGGKEGEGLTPPDVVKYTAAYAAFLLQGQATARGPVIVGRDARISGLMVNQLVVATLMGMGLDVIDIGLTTTPTAEMAVVHKKAMGGIIITASHNPKQWNALKLLNADGEFISAGDGEAIGRLAASGDMDFSGVDSLGSLTTDDGMIDFHLSRILEIPLVDKEAIRKAGFRIAVDCVNSTGGLSVPKLLRLLGVEHIIEMFCEPNGHFPHNPEPLPENLNGICETVRKDADLGIVVDPDVDRLAIICEDGVPFGEEYTLVAVADYVLTRQPGNTVSNLSSSQALAEITAKAGAQHFASAVGEVNVVQKMKEVGAVIGGEGNGGVIYPGLHYGRDALVGIALFLTHLAHSGMKCSALRRTYPDYVISKKKISLDGTVDLDRLLQRIANQYNKQPIDTTDGIKVHFDREWVHLRRSNTEPIIRIYAESDSANKAEVLANKFMDDLREALKEL